MNGEREKRNRVAIPRVRRNGRSEIFGLPALICNAEHACSCRAVDMSYATGENNNNDSYITTKRAKCEATFLSC